MADALVPYSSNRDIVLRHNDSVVVFDPSSKRLVVRNVHAGDGSAVAECPYCHQPYQHERQGSRPTSNGAGSTAVANFASPDYFRMLGRCLPASEDSARPPSPRRRLTQLARSRQSSGASTPLRPAPESRPASALLFAQEGQGISSEAFSPGYFRRFFEEERELGRGGKGVVLLVRHVIDGVNLGQYACKRIPVGDDHAWLKKVLVEVQLLSHLQHDNLVLYRHVWLEDVTISKFGPSVPCAFVLQQYCNGGDLQGYIGGNLKTSMTSEELKDRVRRRSRQAPELPKFSGPRKLQFDEIRSFFRDITSGLNYLHVNNYVHRDLKPSNCLLHHTGADVRVLVSDFGEVQAENQARESTGATGTISYCAPEVLQRDASTGALRNFTTKSDIFSLGMILHFLCFAQLPYRNADGLHEDDEDVDQLRDEIAMWAGLEDERGMRSDLPDELYRSLHHLLSLDPNQRPSAEEILHGLDSIKTRPILEKTKKRSKAQVLVGEEGEGPVHLSSATSTAQAVRPTRRTSPPTRLGSSRDPDREPPDFGEAGGRASALEASLILRTRSALPSKPIQSPRLLTAPPGTWYFSYPPTAVDPRRAVKMIFFLLKIMSIYLTCLPAAAKPTAGLALLGLAVVDLLMFDLNLTRSFLLMALHSVILFATMQVDMLCLPQVALWEAL